MPVRQHRNRVFFLLVLPSLLYLFLLIIVPSFYAVKLALTAPAGTQASQQPAVFPSFVNFLGLFSDSEFWLAVRNNLIIPILSVVVELTFGLALALLLSQQIVGRGLFRTIALLPFAVPEIVFLIMMKYVFSEHGYLNSVLEAANLSGVFWLEPRSLLALCVVVLVDAWHVTPVVFLILLSALESISTDIYEAARIDGTTGWTMFWYIVLPLLVPAILVALVLRSIDAFRIFATPLVLLGYEGAPVISSYAYHYWIDYSNESLASCATTVLAVVILALSYIYVKLWKQAERIEG
jgi:ABC-type sugar transport system permease subunit